MKEFHFGKIWKIFYRNVSNNMKMTLKFNVSRAYGVKRYYPACEISEIMALISRKKTLSQANIDLILESGFEIEIVPKESSSK